MHLVPYNPGAWSESLCVNLVWRDADVYIMDNHRVAAWCWAQHVPPLARFSLFHIDQHYDYMTSKLESWLRELGRVEHLRLTEYLSADWKTPECGIRPIVQWDNYLPIFLEQRKGLLDKAYFMTHERGSKPMVDHREVSPVTHPKDIAYYLANTSKCVFNLDLDFFFMVTQEKPYRLFADDYVRNLAAHWKLIKDAGNLYCTTIALSPEICGGWDASERVLETFCSEAGINTHLGNKA